MAKIDLKVQKILMEADKQEQGLILAMRACKGLVYAILDGKGERNVTPEHADQYIAEQCPDYYKQAQNTLVDSILKENRGAYEKANRWLTKNLAQAWRQEDIEEYCTRNNYKEE